MKLLIIENDYKDIEHKHFINQVFYKYGFKRIFVQSGGFGCCLDCFWEV